MNSYNPVDGATTYTRTQLCATFFGYLGRAYEGAGLSGVKSVKAPERIVTVSGVVPMMSPSTISRAGFSVSSVSVRTCAIVSIAKVSIAIVDCSVYDAARNFRLV